ncbi:MAG: hypothetical protein JXR76_15400 [Deltaproteobacteria bacterium]|nr:hypothetical protein [Deltaproteobacteria bacterium]
MGSMSKELREKQLEKAVASFKAVEASLKEKGLSDKEAAKDSVYRKLRAAVLQGKRRIAAIDSREAHVSAMKEKITKAEKVAKEKKVAAVAQTAGKAKTKTPKKKKK